MALALGKTKSDEIEDQLNLVRLLLGISFRPGFICEFI